MNTETKTETYEQYVARRERELFNERIAKDKSNLDKNRAMLHARFGRLGINRPLARTQADIEEIAKEERAVLGANVEAHHGIVQPETAEKLAVDGTDNTLIDKSNTSITVGKDAENGLNVTLIGENIIVSERVDCLDYFDLAKPCVVDGGVSLDLGGASSEIGGVSEVAHLSCTEILEHLGANLSQANRNTVSSILKGAGLVSSKVQGKRGYRLTVRS